MKAFWLVAPGQTEVRDIERPELRAEEVLLEVGMVGFCGGDLNGFRGTFPLQEYPVVLGHEIGATVVRVGANVPAGLAPGARATVYPYQQCGACLPCRKHRPNACADNKTMGVRRPGGITEYLAVPWQDVIVSETLSVRELALVEPLAVGFHAVDRGRVAAGDTVVVLGCGIVGMGAVAGAWGRGARVIAVDIDRRKLDIARKAGAIHGIETSRIALEQALTELTGRDGPDVVIEAIGNRETYRAAVDRVSFTGRVVCVGYAKMPVEYETRLFVQKEIELRGSRNCVKETDFPAVMRCLEQGRFPVDDVITRVVSIDDAGRALREWSENPGL